jgi:hypothetical protein
VREELASAWCETGCEREPWWWWCAFPAGGSSFFGALDGFEVAVEVEAAGAGAVEGAKCCEGDAFTGASIGDCDLTAPLFDGGFLAELGLLFLLLLAESMDALNPASLPPAAELGLRLLREEAREEVDFSTFNAGSEPTKEARRSCKVAKGELSSSLL